MTTKSPSLRQIAQELGVSHSLLSLWRQGKRTLKPEIETRYWAFVTNSGYRSGDSPDSGFQRNNRVVLNKMVPRGGLEPPTHGFSVLPNDPVNAFLDDRISRGLSVATIKFYKDYLERLQISLLSPLLVTTKTQMRTFLSDLTCTPGGKHAYLRAARTFFNWAVEEQYIAVSPCKNLSVKVPNADRYTL